MVAFVVVCMLLCLRYNNIIVLSNYVDDTVLCLSVNSIISSKLEMAHVKQHTLLTWILIVVLSLL